MLEGSSLGISQQTLATYELGTRQCSVTRLIELCELLGVRASDVLALVEARNRSTVAGLHVNLVTLAATKQPALLPARGWAQQQLRGRLPSNTVLAIAALEPLASLCRMNTADLIRALTRDGSARLHYAVPQ